MAILKPPFFRLKKTEESGRQLYNFLKDTMRNLSSPGTTLSIWIHNNVHLGLEFLQLQIDLPNFIKKLKKTHFVSSLTTSETHFSLRHFLQPYTTIQNGKKWQIPYSSSASKYHCNNVIIHCQILKRYKLRQTVWHCGCTRYCVRLFLLTTLHCLFVQTPLMHFHPKKGYDNKLLVLILQGELN